MTRPPGASACSPSSSAPCACSTARATCRICGIDFPPLMGRDRLRSNQGGEVWVSVLSQHSGPHFPTRLVALATLPIREGKALATARRRRRRSGSRRGLGRLGRLTAALAAHHLLHGDELVLVQVAVV